MEKIYDVIVIGSGISGIYFANKYLANQDKMGEYLIVDMNNYIGGRILTKHFCGNDINLGAGIIEKNNTELIKLCRSLELEIIGPIKSKYVHSSSNKSKPVGITEILAIRFNNSLRETYYKDKENIDQKKFTFAEFMSLKYENHDVNFWKNYSEFKDHSESAVKSVIENYPYTDVVTVESEHYYLRGGWKSLIVKLLKKINPYLDINEDFDSYFDDSSETKDYSFLEKSLKIALKLKLTKIIFGKKTKTLIFENGRVIKTKGIAFCADGNIKNIELINKDKIEINENIINKLTMAFDSVGMVPFVKVYTYHENIEMNSNIRTTTMLSKIIQINKNILMICYSEGEDYNKIKGLYTKMGDSEFIETLYEIMLKNVPDIKISRPTDYALKFWNIGTHFYKPGYCVPIEFLRKKSIYLAGEMFSVRHGTVEGAILSVNECLNRESLHN